MIDGAVAAGEELIARKINFGESGNFAGWVKAQERWNALTREMLLAVYEGEEPANEFYSAVGAGSFMVPYADDPVLQASQRLRGFSGGVNTLISLRERLEYAKPPTPPQPVVSEARTVGRGVFLVHGRNEEKKQTVARYLDKITESGAVVLEEQADAGRTIIEKFEQHAGEAGYAVVLLTGDDEGRMRGTDEELRARARQNVILELGFFVGALRRGRVALLYEEGVELPSDISGVLYLRLDDAGAWKQKLAKEMQTAGVGIDAEKVLGA